MTHQILRITKVPCACTCWSALKKKTGSIPKKFKKSQQQKRYTSKDCNRCQGIILLSGLYFLLKGQVIREKKDL